MVGNFWLQVWEEATPIPVTSQKSLFDYTTQAEKVPKYPTPSLLSLVPSSFLNNLLVLYVISLIFKVFHYLETIPPVEFAKQYVSSNSYSILLFILPVIISVC